MAAIPPTVSRSRRSSAPHLPTGSDDPPTLDLRRPPARPAATRRMMRRLERRRRALRARFRRFGLAVALVLVPALVSAGVVLMMQRGPAGDGIDGVLASDKGSAGAGFEYGVRFTSAGPGLLRGVHVYSDRASGTEVAVTLWKSDGTPLSRSSRIRLPGRGWTRADLPAPVTLEQGASYVVSYWSNGRRPQTGQRIRAGAPTPDPQITLGSSLFRRGAGFPSRYVVIEGHPLVPVFERTGKVVTPSATTTAAPSASTPTVTPSASASATPSSPAGSPAPVAPVRTGFPNASNTGVPAGTALAPYTGPCTISSAGAVIDAKTISCGLVIKAPRVVIKRSKVNGQIDVQGSSSSVTVQDSEIDAGHALGPAVGFFNYTVLRSNLHGAQHGALCELNCVIQDSYLHDEWVAPDGGAHLQAFLSNGGSGAKVIHNTLQCDVVITPQDGGCTADISIFGDFDPNANFVFDHNLLLASPRQSYCAYGGYDPKKPFGVRATGIVFTNNVFQRGSNGKCGLYGAVTSFNPGLSGNTWSGNVWDDGTPLQSSL